MIQLGANLSMSRSELRAERANLALCGLKRCSPTSGCGAIVAVERFSRDANAADGLRPICRECDKVATARRRNSTPEAWEKYQAATATRQEREGLAREGLKRCAKSGCGEVKSASEFHSDSRATDGLNAKCKECNVSGAQKWYQDNPERAFKRREARRGDTRLYGGALRARAAGCAVDDFCWGDLLSHWGEKGVDPLQCHLCGEKGEYRGLEGLHVDHVTPIARGGGHVMANLLPACAKCNHMKHSDTLDEYKARVVKSAAHLSLV